MKNKTLAIFGIGTYILSVLSSATDLEGNSIVPFALIVISGIATAIFIIMAIVRLWKEAKGVSIILASSTLILYILTAIHEFTFTSYGSPFIILLNTIKVIDLIAFIWAVSLLWKMAKHEGLAKKFLKHYDGFTTKEASLIQEDSRKGNYKSCEQRIAVMQEQARAEYKESTGLNIQDIIPEVGREISWLDIVNHVFRVMEFDRSDSTIEQNKQVKAKSSFRPYGYLLVESPIMNQKVKLPIIHRDDFLLAISVFDEPKLAGLVADEELLVTYSPKHLLPKGFSGSPHHVLHYVMTPRGTLDSYYSMNNDIHMSKPEPQKLFGSFVYQGEIKVQINPELKI
jgi:hypothetical protein